MFAKFIRVFLLPMSVLLLTGCAESVFRQTSPEIKQVLIGVTNRYLTLVASGDEHNAGQMIYWPEFADGGRLTPVEFHRQFVSAQNRWTPAEHPLIGLNVVEASASGNYAKVVLRKDPKVAGGKSNFSDIWVRLMWAGRGWIITEDSIFGADKLFSNLPPKG